MRLSERLEKPIKKKNREKIDMNTKKVVIILTEGINDVEFLKPYLKELVDESKIKFEITNGDLLTKDEFKNTNAKNIIGNKLNDICNKRKYKINDILFVAHILDLDGSYISESAFVIDSRIEDKCYNITNNQLIVKNEGKMKELIRVWKTKREKQKVLYSTEKIKKIDYIIMYNSINLEHVLSNSIIFDQSEKEKCVDDFITSKDLDGFIRFISSPDILLDKDYKKSWEIIANNSDGFRRASNLFFLINRLNPNLSLE